MKSRIIINNKKINIEESSEQQESNKRMREEWNKKMSEMDEQIEKQKQERRSWKQ